MRFLRNARSLPSLSPRDRRTLLVGGMAVGCIGVFGNGAPALERWQTQRVAEAAEIRERLAVALGGAGSMTAIRDSARQRSRRLEAVRSTLVSAATAEAAASQLAELIGSIATDVEVDVMTVALKPDTVVRSELARVGVRLSAECDVQGLSDFLYEVESNDVPIIVRELSLTQSDALAPTSRMEALRVDLVLETLARIAPRPAKSATPTTKQ